MESNIIGIGASPGAWYVAKDQYELSTNRNWHVFSNTSLTLPFVVNLMFSPFTFPLRFKLNIPE